MIACTPYVYRRAIGRVLFTWSNGNCRPYGEYRAVNAATKPARYPIPYVQDFSDRLAAGTTFSKFHLVRTYHQTPDAPEDRGRTKNCNRHRV